MVSTVPPLLGINLDGDGGRLPGLGAIRDLVLERGKVADMFAKTALADPDLGVAMGPGDPQEQPPARPVRGITTLPLVPAFAHEVVPDLVRLAAVALIVPDAGDGDLAVGLWGVTG